MKKLFLLSFVLLGFALSAKAQSGNQATISKHAIGLRLGDNDGFGGEVSYQHGLGSSNRLEVDLGWRDGKNYSAFKLTGLYQWVFGLGQGFNWFVGAGGGIVSWSIDDKHIHRDDRNGFGVFIAGDIGIEYHFSIPLMLALDFRPELGFGDFNDDLGLDIALSIRYKF